MAHFISHPLLRARNHLAILASMPISVPNNTIYDFSISTHVEGGVNQLKEVDTDIYALNAGDVNGDGVISVMDFNIYQAHLANINVYSLGDFNLDGEITVSDLNLYLPNASKIGVGELRD